MDTINRDAVLAGLIFGQFGDERFKSGLRRGDFDFPAGRAFERKDQLAVGIVALAELNVACGKGKIDGDGAEGKRRSAQSELVDFKGRGCP